MFLFDDDTSLFSFVLYFKMENMTTHYHLEIHYLVSYSQRVPDGTVLLCCKPWNYIWSDK